MCKIYSTVKTKGVSSHDVNHLVESHKPFSLYVWLTYVQIVIMWLLIFLRLNTLIENKQINKYNINKYKHECKVLLL